MINKPDNSSIINICIVPDNSVGGEYLDISQSLKSPETMFVLDGDRFAHMTVFMARFANNDIDKIVGAVECCLANTVKFNCRQTGYFAPYNYHQKQNAIETGYDLAHGLYRPHITLTRYNIMPDKIPKVPDTDLSFDVDRICIYKADDNGAIYELVKAFGL